MNSVKSSGSKLLIHLVAAARPNFMKVAPLYHTLKRESWADPIIIHTGQHYDLNMSKAFFEDLDLPEPHLHLGVGSGTHAEQTGQVMIKYEKVLMESQPDLVIVVGDVNSTLACALTASKIVYPEISDKRRVTSNEYPEPITQDLLRSTRYRPLVGHLEAGLRSFDRSMPEEINRVVTDSISDLLWTPSPDAHENLIREGIPSNKIHRVGNIMIDSLEMLRGKVEEQTVYKDLDLQPGDYALLTLHRPSNVDDHNVLKRICDVLTRIIRKIPIVFPIHPRTRKNLESNGLMRNLSDTSGLFLLEPLNYISFMNLTFNCRFAITDSGGIQEETTYLGIPCLTMRPNTERPITISQGTNRLCRPDNLESLVDEILERRSFKASVPELWDGQTSYRVVKSINDYLC